MFLDYYGLREQPFGVTPDPRFLYFVPSHGEALASLYYGIASGRGFLALIAEPGMGKTTLLFHLLGKLRQSARTAFIFQTQCNSQQLLKSLMADLGVECRENDDLFDLQSQLNEVLIRENQAGKRFVLVVDEAQNLEDSVLETLRMLSNFETPSAKLMQIILAGQPQLAIKLATARLVQLRQRISIVSRLTPLTPAETKDYIDHRLLVAGYTGEPLFRSEALERIAHASQGIPRNINNLCFNALTLGFARDEKRIDSSILEEVLSDLALESICPRPVIKEDAIADPLVIRNVRSSPGTATSRRGRLACGILAVAATARASATAAAATLRIRGKFQGPIRAVVASATKARPYHWLASKSQTYLRRMGAALLIIIAACAAAWLAFGRANASPQRQEPISAGLKIWQPLLAEGTLPRVWHSTRRHSQTRRLDARAACQLQWKAQKSQSSPCYLRRTAIVSARERRGRRPENS